MAAAVAERRTPLVSAPLARLGAALSRPVDAASFTAFRILFGLLLLAALGRALANGAVEQAFVVPTYFFPYYGLDFLVAPAGRVFLLYGLLALAAGCIAAGFYTRPAAGVFCLVFSYLHFVDATNYLNHYYLVSLLTALLALVPSTSVSAGWRAEQPLPSWVLLLFRFQFGLVYFFGGLAKLKPDWLLLAEPLRTWLRANTDVPLLGPLFRYDETAWAMSWLGAAYDLTIPFALSFRRTRPYAYAAVVSFHLLTARLFQIGMFPYLMIIGSLLFLRPDWPRRALRLPARPLPHDELASLRGALPWLALYVAVQVLLPLRHLLYPGNMLWTEYGYRFAWHVMVMEKAGSAEFRVVETKTRTTRVIFPRSILTRSQTKAMATQPDMILAFARELARRDRARGREVQVYADVFVALNGRPATRFIDPTVDLAREREGLGPKAWVLPSP